MPATIASDSTQTISAIFNGRGAVLVFQKTQQHCFHDLNPSCQDLTADLLRKVNGKGLTGGETAALREIS